MATLPEYEEEWERESCCPNNRKFNCTLQPNNKTAARFVGTAFREIQCSHQHSYTREGTRERHWLSAAGCDVVVRSDCKSTSLLSKSKFQVRLSGNPSWQSFGLLQLAFLSSPAHRELISASIHRPAQLAKSHKEAINKAAVHCRETFPRPCSGWKWNRISFWLIFPTPPCLVLHFLEVKVVSCCRTASLLFLHLTEFSECSLFYFALDLDTLFFLLLLLLRLCLFS